MKKVLLVCLCFLFVFTACGKNDGINVDGKNVVLIEKIDSTDYYSFDIFDIKELLKDASVNVLKLKLVDSLPGEIVDEDVYTPYEFSIIDNFNDNEDFKLGDNIKIYIEGGLVSLKDYLPYMADGAVKEKYLSESSDYLSNNYFHMINKNQNFSFDKDDEFIVMFKNEGGKNKAIVGNGVMEIKSDKVINNKDAGEDFVLDELEDEIRNILKR